MQRRCPPPGSLDRGDALDHLNALLTRIDALVLELYRRVAPPPPESLGDKLDLIAASAVAPEAALAREHETRTRTQARQAIRKQVRSRKDAR